MALPEIRDSDLDRGGSQVVELLGAPRSGTTWLQCILGSHPEIASPQELTLISRYVVPMVQQWQSVPVLDQGRWSRQRFTGLPALLSRTQFDAWISYLVRVCIRESLNQKPGSRVFLQKDPPNCLHLESLQEYLRPTLYIHLIRDGRDVVDSLLRASKSWGDVWAPSNIFVAARVWRESVQGARNAADYGPYIEVRYEELRTEPVPIIRMILNRLGLDDSEDTIEYMLNEADSKRDESVRSTALERCLVWGGEARGRGYVLREPEGFRGRGGGGWVSWSRTEILVFLAESGHLMYELGYLERSPMIPVATRNALDYLSDSLAKFMLRLGRWGEALGASAPVSGSSLK